MGIITILDHGIYYEFERSDEETQNILRMLSGAKIIRQGHEHNLKQDIAEEKTTYNIVDNETFYNPTRREITNYISSKPEYKHTTREILAYFNKDVDINDIKISRDGGKISDTWYSVLQKLRGIRNNIQKSEKGEWVINKIGLENEFRFKKY